MKYYKDLMRGAVIQSATMPTAGLWREATEREFNEYRARVTRLIRNLEAANAYKARLLGVKA